MFYDDDAIIHGQQKKEENMNKPDRWGEIKDSWMDHIIYVYDIYNMIYGLTEKSVVRIGIGPDVFFDKHYYLIHLCGTSLNGLNRLALTQIDVSFDKH